MKRQQKKEKLNLKRFQIAKISNSQIIFGGSIVLSEHCSDTIGNTITSGGNDTATEG